MTMRVLSKPEATDTRPGPVSEFFRFMLDYSDLKGLDAGLRGARTNVAWIVDIAGPEGASVYEVMAAQRYTAEDGRRGRRSGQPFRRPGLEHVAPPADHSLSRYNASSGRRGGKGIVDAHRMMAIRDVRWEDGGATFGIRYSSSRLSGYAVLHPITRSSLRRVHGRSG